MTEYEKILEVPPYSLDRISKSQLLTAQLKRLCFSHYSKCQEYRRIIDALGYHIEVAQNYEELPLLPVRLFKDLELKSIEKEDIFKVMTSSATTGQAVSKIYLDKNTAANQQKTLVKIVSDFTGKGRLPMIIIDCPSVIKDRTNFSARGAGILGFSILSSDRIYALDDEFNIDFDAINAFLEKHKEKKILIFGFTFMIWQYFYKSLNQSSVKYDFSDAILIHGGGWKKLQQEAVESIVFKEELKRICGISSIYDYYGMVEQTGCIYMECEHGHLHASIFSDVITRRTKDFSVCDIGEEGIIQVVSMLPESYPGHSILTEDMGIILGEDDCPCGRLGKYFKIIGRMKNAEVRGCSDTIQK
jgi:phenylacetate-coenzyme A ligase PaaK-like adenylate-forming protein